MVSARHFFDNHLRLAITVVVGVAVALALPASWKPDSRILAGWNITVWLYLCLMGWLMMRSDPVRVRKLAEQEDESAGAVLVIMSIASVASLAAIILELSTVKDLPANLRLSHYAFTIATVFGSWCLLGTLFTHHYARLFYRSKANQRPLHFPEGEQNPDYWDFLYFSFTIAVAAQTADVSVMNRAARKAVLAQAVLSFLFNVAIVGLSINIAASLIGS
ncbi:DUF1345 domain-containing protein [Paralcaligenes sp. KSB-10]|uniref:DUF1345 domain-containing protein n=1 Tax=Paralcaligenes sp. KSB-10 TaxID=2901142 RepID=UPI001E445D29|nr:DUF1345 domain-containing protein [Paralcaligenes sp. KSB-10]UHL64850.1 DUF1345 domain-containing protein [Paralcaligenes sp. KSB-10]